MVNACVITSEYKNEKMRLWPQGVFHLIERQYDQAYNEVIHTVLRKSWEKGMQGCPGKVKEGFQKRVTMIQTEGKLWSK